MACDISAQFKYRNSKIIQPEYYRYVAWRPDEAKWI